MFSWNLFSWNLFKLCPEGCERRVYTGDGDVGRREDCLLDTHLERYFECTLNTVRFSWEVRAIGDVSVSLQVLVTCEGRSDMTVPSRPGVYCQVTARELLVNSQQPLSQVNCNLLFCSLFHGWGFFFPWLHTVVGRRLVFAQYRTLRIVREGVAHTGKKIPVDSSRVWPAIGLQLYGHGWGRIWG